MSRGKELPFLRFWLISGLKKLMMRIRKRKMTRKRRKRRRSKGRRMTLISRIYRAMSTTLMSIISFIKRTMAQNFRIQTIAVLQKTFLLKM